MITGVHTMFYTSEPEAMRAFLRDTLRFPATDVGGGWLVFDLPDAEMGCHPTQTDHGGTVASGTPSISFYCDDLDATIGELKARGVEFTAGVTDAGYGLVTRFRVPGGFDVELYQPRYTRQSENVMATARQKAAARSNVTKAAAGAKRRRTLTRLPKQTRTALGKEGAKAARRKRRAR
jgi:catechol 2,3-dioxygenase-like lactoylglutathione lyase family enzyme